MKNTPEGSNPFPTIREENEKESRKLILLLLQEEACLRGFKEGFYVGLLFGLVTASLIYLLIYFL